jgi:hypothetical protein
MKIWALFWAVDREEVLISMATQWVVLEKKIGDSVTAIS